MARKPPKIDHVKHVLRRGKWYSYFNTGQKKNGQPIRRPMPEWGTTGFWDSYAAFMAGRTKRQVTEYTVAHLADEYLSTNRFAELAEATQKNYRVQCRKIKEVWGKFPVNHLEPHHVRAVLEKEDWGAGTRNMVVATLGVIYKWGRKNNRAAVDPVKDIDHAEGCR